MKRVLVRHEERIWNRENRFNAWTVVDLTGKGRAEAVHAGKALQSFATQGKAT